MLGKKDTPIPSTPITPQPTYSPPPSTSEAKMNALLGKGSEFEGKLSFEGTVRVEGVMKGEIKSKDKLIVGEGARVEAEIDVGSAVISGQVTGNITAAGHIELKAPARVKGNITTPELVIEKGVVFDGNCSMSGAKGAAPKQP